MPRLRCHYHGWEYGADGRVAKVPDGRSFKGLVTADKCLPTARVERLGPLVFVNLAADAPPLRQLLGQPLADELDVYFDHHSLFVNWVTEHQTNWKVIVENAVESYHVPCAHSGTFGDYRAEELHDHRLESAYTRYDDLEPLGNSMTDRVFRMMTRLLLQNPRFDRWKHTHIFPNYCLYYRELYSSWAIIEPLSPERTRYVLLGFLPKAIRWPLLARPLQHLFSAAVRVQFKRILKEDMIIWANIHRGLKSSSHQGVLSCREERVYAFQKYLVDAVGKPPAIAEHSPRPVACASDGAETG